MFYMIQSVANQQTCPVLLTTADDVTTMKKSKEHIVKPGRLYFAKQTAAEQVMLPFWPSVTPAHR